jgi:hypothetical protein
MRKQSVGSHLCFCTLTRLRRAAQRSFFVQTGVLSLTPSFFASALEPRLFWTARHSGGADRLRVDVQVRDAGAGRPARVLNRHGNVQRLAEEQVVVGAVDVELVTQTEELAETARVRLEGESVAHPRAYQAGRRLHARERRRGPALLQVLLADGDPHVMATLRPLLCLERLTAGHRQVVALSSAHFDERGARILPLTDILHVGPPLGCIWLKALRRHGVIQTLAVGRPRRH